MPNHGVDWDNYPNFEKVEFDCKESGENNMWPEFIDVMQKIRDVYGKPMFVSSGYRSVMHSLEIVKDVPGEHTLGLAADFRVFGESALDLVDVALMCGIRRVGIHQKDSHANRFIHLGMADQFFKGYPKGIWTY